MEQKQIQQVLAELQRAYPKYDISALSTKQRGERHLIVIKGFENIGDIDDWSVDMVYPILWKMLRLLEEHKEANHDLRLLFIRDNQFVLWSPDVGCGNVFREIKKPIHKDVYGDQERQHYVGECQDINDVLEYLTTTQVWF